MNRVMRIGPSDNLLDRAMMAIDEAVALHQLPMRWIAGREVYWRIRHNRDSMIEHDSLFGIKVERKIDAPSDLLELDAF